MPRSSLVQAARHVVTEIKGTEVGSSRLLSTNEEHEFLLSGSTVSHARQNMLRHLILEKGTRPGAPQLRVRFEAKTTRCTDDNLLVRKESVSLTRTPVRMRVGHIVTFNAVLVDSRRVRHMMCKSL